MAIAGASQFAGNYGNGKGRAMKGDKMGKGLGEFKRGELRDAPKTKKRKVAVASVASKVKPKKMGRGRMGGARKMAEPMSDQDFGVR